MKISFEFYRQIENLKIYIYNKNFLFKNMKLYDIKQFIIFINSTFILFLLFWTCIICFVHAR